MILEHGLATFLFELARVRPQPLTGPSPLSPHASLTALGSIIANYTLRCIRDTDVHDAPKLPKPTR